MKMKDLFPISTVNSIGVDEGVSAWGCQMCHMFRKTCKTSVRPTQGTWQPPELPESQTWDIRTHV